MIFQMSTFPNAPIHVWHVTSKFDSALCPIEFNFLIFKFLF